MNLDSPITINPPNLIRPDGSIVSFPPVTIDKLDITIIDNFNRKQVLAQIKPCSLPLVLWENDQYESAGDYTQAQAEARVLELLGENPKAVLETLFAHIKPDVRR